MVFYICRMLQERENGTCCTLVRNRCSTINEFKIKMIRLTSIFTVRKVVSN